MIQQNFDKIKEIKELQTIPGVGKSISVDLWNLGIKNVSDLKGKNPKTLYNRSNKLAGINKILVCYIHSDVLFILPRKKDWLRKN